MKKSIFPIILLVIFGLSFISNAQTITSVANGNWTNPATWGGSVPHPGNDIVINHTVTLNIDWGYESGSIKINPSGILVDNSTMRGMAIGNTLTVYGTFKVARVIFYGGNITNSGSFQIDSLLNSTNLTNNFGASINVGQFLNSTGGTFNNNGTLALNYLANIDTVINYGTISTYNLTNSKSFINNQTGLIDVANNFLNTDSLANPSLFTNNGQVNVINNWRNIAMVNGSGKFCIQNNSNNSGTMSGAFDFCDLTGGYIDANTGTIAGTITYCQYSCTVGTKEKINNAIIKIYPNPSNGVLSVFVKNFSSIINIEIFNMLGKIIYSKQLDGDTSEINLSKQAKGIYFYQIKSEEEIINTGKIIIE